MYFAQAREALGIRRARSVVHGARAESCRFWASKQARHLDGHTLLWQRAIRSSVSGADLSDSTLAVPKIYALFIVQWLLLQRPSQHSALRPLHGSASQLPYVMVCFFYEK